MSEVKNNVLVKPRKLYELYVPTMFNDGVPIRTKYHKEWDKKVYKITNGLTILKPAKGIWVSPSGVEFHERMIPVRIACTADQIEGIIQMSIAYYKQEAILAILISEEVLLRHRETTDDELMEIYSLGWDEENDVYSKKKEARIYVNPLLQSAYDTGRLHFRIGDDVSSIDELTRDEILDVIKYIKI